MTTPDVPAERERDKLLKLIERLEDVEQYVDALDGPDGAIAALREYAALLAPQEAPAEGISLSAQLSQAAAWMRVWDECQRLGMDTYGAPSTRTGLDIVLDFIRGHVAPQEARESEAESLIAALRAIIDMEPEPFDFPADWDQQVAACEECKRWKNHPIQQGICDTHRQPLRDRDAHVRSEQLRLHDRMRSIAREALDAHVLAAARPAPETRDITVYGNILPPDAPEALHVTLAPASGEPSGVADARRLADVAREMLHAIESGPMQSIGGINNTFAPQISKAQVKRWRAAIEWAAPAAIDAAMAADTQAEGDDAE